MLSWCSESLKAESHISSRTSSAQKNEEFWSVRCDSLGVRQNTLINLRERGIKDIDIHLLCASTFAHSLLMFKNVGAFPRVNNKRQKNVRPAPV